MKFDSQSRAFSSADVEFDRPITFVPNSEHFGYSIKCLPWNEKVSDSVVETK